MHERESALNKYFKERKEVRPMKLNLKKAVAVVTAALTICAMSVTAFAQGSVKSTGVVTAGGAKDANGNAVQATMASIPAEYAAAVSEIKTTDGLKAVLGDAFVEGMEVVDAMDVSVPAGTPMPVTITFNVPGVGPDTKVAVLHYNGSAWEVIKSTVGDGTITATFTSLSPVAFVVDKNTATGTTSTTTSSSSSSVSPKTGENTGMLVSAAVVAVLALGAGCVFFAKRKNA